MSNKKYATDKQSVEENSEIDFYRGSGPGGQHRNRRETGVRFRHIPSGIVVECDETKSQAQNRKLALQRLQAKLRRLNKPRKLRFPTQPPPSAKEQRIKAKKIRSRKKEYRRAPHSWSI